jgi:hypothetical protein
MIGSWYMVMSQEVKEAIGRLRPITVVYKIPAGACKSSWLMTSASLHPNAPHYVVSHWDWESPLTLLVFNAAVARLIYVTNATARGALNRERIERILVSGSGASTFSHTVALPISLRVAYT